MQKKKKKRFGGSKGTMWILMSMRRIEKDAVKLCKGKQGRIMNLRPFTKFHHHIQGELR